MEESPFNRSGITRRTPPPPSPQQPRPEPVEKVTLLSTPDIQGWMEAIEQHLTEICTVSSEGKLNSDQKLRIHTLCRKVFKGVASLAVNYQSLKQKAIETRNALEHAVENKDLMDSLTQIKRSVQESSMKQEPASASFADMVKKGSSNFVRPSTLSSVVIYPSDNSKTSEDTKTLVEKIISPEAMKLQVRGVRKIRNGGVVISTETKKDVEKLKQTVQLAQSGLKVDEPLKRKPRIIVIGVPATLTENEVYKCMYEQNVADKIPSMTKDTFMTSIKLSHKSGKKNAETCNYIMEVSAVIRKALITQNRLFINWTSCPVRDFTSVTRCFKCQQYGHAARTCKTATSTCGHCGEDGHSIQDCSKKAESPKCATCLRFKKPSNHKTGDADCPARQAAEYRYINSVDYEGA